MVAPGFLESPEVRRWLNGVEPAWTMLEDQGGGIRCAARDCPFYVALPPPDLNDWEHRKGHLSSETDRPREGAVGGKLIHERSTEQAGVSIREVHGV